MIDNVDNPSFVDICNIYIAIVQDHCQVLTSRTRSQSPARDSAAKWFDRKSDPRVHIVFAAPALGKLSLR